MADEFVNIENELEDEDGVEDFGTIHILGDKEGSETDSNADMDSNTDTDVYPAVNINIDRVQFSIFEVKRRYNRGMICLDPDFQRNYVWKSRQKSELIESVLMGIPLPLIYLAETIEGNLVIVDGRQRLTTFFDYMDNKFMLKGLRILGELNGYRFSDLEKDKDKRKFAANIEDFQLVIQIIKYPTPDRVRFDIFDRVNRGGTPLNNQEMRNALYQGKSTRMLKRMAGDEAFQKATGASISSLHMKDKYIILRAICFYLWKNEALKKADGKPVKYRSDIEEFLGYGMEQINHMDDVEIEALIRLFHNVMECSYDVLGENAFRIPTDRPRRRPVSMTLFESLFYFLTLWIQNPIACDAGRIHDSVEEMLEDSGFLQALTYNVDSVLHVAERFAVVEKKFMEISEC